VLQHTRDRIAETHPKAQLSLHRLSLSVEANAVRMGHPGPGEKMSRRGLCGDVLSPNSAFVGGCLRCLLPMFYFRRILFFSLVTLEADHEWLAAPHANASPRPAKEKFVSGVMWLIARCVLNRSAPFMRPPVVSPAV
jgi:hypothetical protein